MTDYCEIALSRGKIALVDEADFERISQHKWYANLSHGKGNTFYAVRQEPLSGGGQRTVYMHREIMGLTPEDLRRVDHREPEQTLDNRRGNLRVATPAQQSRNRRLFKNNRSGLKGVTRSGNGRWAARIGHEGRVIHLGMFDAPELAHAAYCAEAVKLHGEFARFA